MKLRDGDSVVAAEVVSPEEEDAEETENTEGIRGSAKGARKMGPFLVKTGNYSKAKRKINKL